MRDIRSYSRYIDSGRGEKRSEKKRKEKRVRVSILGGCRDSFLPHALVHVVAVRTCWVFFLGLGLSGISIFPKSPPNRLVIPTNFISGASALG